MKKMMNVGLLLTNNGAVTHKYVTKRVMPGISSISEKQKKFARAQVSRMLPKWREAKFSTEFAEEFSDQCLRVGLDPNRLGKLKTKKQPHCLLYLPQIGGDPYVRIVNQDEWTAQMENKIETEVDEKITVNEHGTMQIQELEENCQQVKMVPEDIQSPFSSEQLKLLNKVERLKLSLNTLINPATGINTKYRHVILAGAAGLGKTHFVRSFLERNQLPNAKITAGISLFSLGVRLACIMANRNPDEILYIHIDDADVAFKTEEGCNLLKQMLFDENAFVYERNIGPLLQGFPNEVRDAVESFRSENSLGFRVPLENVVFLITTNIPLPSDSEVVNLFGKSGQSGILVHRNAIRSRCRYRYLDFTREMRWAWIASVFLVDGRIPDHENFITKVMLDFMWENRQSMQEYTIRTAELMLKIAREYPRTFIHEWQNEFLWHLN